APPPPADRVRAPAYDRRKAPYGRGDAGSDRPHPTAPPPLPTPPRPSAPPPRTPPVGSTPAPTPTGSSPRSAHTPHPAVHAAPLRRRLSALPRPGRPGSGALLSAYHPDPGRRRAASPPHHSSARLPRLPAPRHPCDRG